MPPPHKSGLSQKAKSARAKHLDEVARLQARIDVLERKERANERRRSKHATTTRPNDKGMIPRPKGRPGRNGGKGYKIIEEMGLSEKREQYNHIMRTVRKLANKHLDTACTITQQKNSLVVEKVIREVQLRIKGLMKFENAWPVRDILGQFLRNSSQAEKRILAMEQRREGKKKAVNGSDDDLEGSESGDPDNSDGWNSNAEMEDEDEEDGDQDMDEEVDVGLEEDLQPESEDEGENNDGSDDEASIGKRRRHARDNNANKRPSKRHREGNMANETGEKSQQKTRSSIAKKAKSTPSEVMTSTNKGGPGKSGTRQEATTTSQLKTQSSSQVIRNNQKANVANGKKQAKTPLNIVDDTAAPQHQWQSPGPDEDEHADGADTDEASDDNHAPIALPKTCPGIDCSDTIPSDAIPEQLKIALTRYVNLSQEKKTDIRLAAEICILIKHKHQRSKHLEIAREKNWPATTIDFKEIPNRILAMYDELKQIMLVREARENLFVWNCFEADLESDGWSIARFSRMKTSQIPMTSEVWRNSRGGYYGSKGVTIVTHTLLQLFPPRTTPSDAFEPLPFLHYLSYFIVPHIIALLIAQDYNKSTALYGHRIMTASSDTGEFINPERDDDNELDTINHRTTMALKGMANRISEQREELESAAKALVSLQTYKPGEATQETRPKPRIVLLPPRLPTESEGTSERQGDKLLSHSEISTGGTTATQEPPQTVGPTESSDRALDKSYSQKKTSKMTENRAGPSAQARKRRSTRSKVSAAISQPQV